MTTTRTEGPMLRLIKPLVWTLLFLVMMLAIDQLLIQVPPLHPAHAAVTDFYRDFRSRLINLAFGDRPAAPESIEAVIEGQAANRKKAQQEPAKQKSQISPATRAEPKAPQRYIYSDSKGELQFADSLEEVPKEYRGQAQPMGE